MSVEHGYSPELPSFDLNNLSNPGLAVTAEGCCDSHILATILEIATNRALDDEFDEEAHNLVLLTIERQKQVLKDDISFDIQAAMFDMPSAPDPTMR